jgi:hypothetical protein
VSRPLTPGEISLGRGIFGDAIDYERVRIVALPWGRTAFVIGSRVHFPHPPADFAAEALGPRGWFVHELVHVQQFQDGWLRTAWSWLVVVLTGGYGRGLPGYRYAAPFAAWGAYNLEQQAAMVEHAYVLRETGACAPAPQGATLADYEACVPYLVSTISGS